MRYEVSSRQGQSKLPKTAVYQLLDNQLIIFLRPWGSQDYNQKFTDEVMHFLSTAQADIEITSPFDYVENLTSLANKVRISLLLAHDYFYKIENKTSFSVGFEAAIIMKNKNEFAWGAVGRFDIYKSSEKSMQLLSAVGSEHDGSVLLPVEMLGVEKDFILRCGSLTLGSQDGVVIASVYGSSTYIKRQQDDPQGIPNVEDENSTYWISKLKSE